MINTYTQESKRMRCLASPGIRKMQMTSTMWHHYEPTRTADMKAGEDRSHKNSVTGRSGKWCDNLLES